MPSNETKQIEINNHLTAKPKTSSVRKANGTRIGVLLDWRDGSTKTVNQRHGNTIRDGR